MCWKISAHADGGRGEGTVKRVQTVSEDPHRREQKFVQTFQGNVCEPGVYFKMQVFSFHQSSIFVSESLSVNAKM